MGKAFATLIVSFGSFFFGGLVLERLFNWFIVPQFGVTELKYALALGIMIFVGFLLSSVAVMLGMIADKWKIKLGLTLPVATFIAYTLLFLEGYIVHLFV